MLDPRHRLNRPVVRTIAVPGDNSTAVLLRFAASAVTLAGAVVLTLLR